MWSTGAMSGTARSPTEELVDAAASYNEVDALELPPLYDTIDSDALERCLQMMDDPEVTFGYAGVEVTVTGTGTDRVRVAEPTGTGTQPKGVGTTE